jgi:1,4-alpha-glucan branching enzyme
MKTTKAPARVASVKPRPPRAAPKRRLRESRQIEGLAFLGGHATEKAITFEFAAEAGSRVFIAGSFNAWDPSAHPLTYHPAEGLFRVTLLLAPGLYEYKFVVDGVWHVDVRCPHWALNGNGTLNSVIQI